MTAGRRVTARRLQDVADQLTGHDLKLLHSVSRLRFMRGDQLTRLHFSDRPTPQARARATRRALSRLMDVDCLERLPRRVGGARSGSAATCFYLGLAGQRLAMERGWQPMRRKRRALVPGTMFLAHALQVAELHTLLYEADREEKLELLELAAEPACWQRLSGDRGQAARLKPDSFARFFLGDWEELRWLEVDMGTEGSGAIERQLRRYLAFQATGQFQAEHGVFPRVLWLTPDAARAAAIWGCVDRLPKTSRALFAAAPFADLIPTLVSPEEQHTSNGKRERQE